jgi:hypothetical protein
MSSKKRKLPLVVRTLADLRSALFDELDRMRCGKSNATDANAIAVAARRRKAAIAKREQAKTK